MTNNNYKGYSLYEEQQGKLQVWNRAVTMFNIMDAHGKEEAKAYANCFDKGSITKMYVMFEAILAKGVDAVRKEVLA